MTKVDACGILSKFLKDGETEESRVEENQEFDFVFAELERVDIPK